MKWARWSKAKALGKWSTAWRLCGLWTWFSDDSFYCLFLTMAKSKNRPSCLSAKNRSSFAYPTIKDRVPIIVCKVIDLLYRHRSVYPDTDSIKQAIELMVMMSMRTSLQGINDQTHWSRLLKLECCIDERLREIKKTRKELQKKVLFLMPRQKTSASFSLNLWAWFSFGT